MLLSIPGGLVSDVAFASMAGATKVLDGALPYGNLAYGDLVHGDTYPLLAYLAYVPAALVAPVRGGFDNLDGALWVATGFALVAAVALGVAVRRAGGDGMRDRARDAGVPAGDDRGLERLQRRGRGGAACAVALRRARRSTAALTGGRVGQARAARAGAAVGVPPSRPARPVRWWVRPR